MIDGLFRQKAPIRNTRIDRFVDSPGEPSQTHDPDPLNSSDDGIDIYMEEIKTIPRLSHEQTTALFKALQEKRQSYQQVLESLGSKHIPLEQLARKRRLEREIARLKDTLVSHNLRLVVYLAHRYHGRGVTLQDLIQEGNIGLIHAIGKFDHTLGYRFSTYATYWIRQAMLGAIYQQANPIRLPFHVLDKLRRQDREVDSRKVAQSEQTSGEVKSDSHEILQLKEILKDPLPLETLSPDGLDLIEITTDENQPTPEERAVIEDLAGKLRSALSSLPNREKTILKLRYGIDSPHSHTLQEVGQLFKLTKERIRQIECKALRHLSKAMSIA